MSGTDLTLNKKGTDTKLKDTKHLQVKKKKKSVGVGAICKMVDC